MTIGHQVTWEYKYHTVLWLKAQTWSRSKTVTPFTLTLGNICNLSVPLLLSVKGQKTRSYAIVLL